jgi:hypothetical protein
MAWSRGIPPTRLPRLDDPPVPGCLCCQGGSVCPAQQDKGSCPALHEAEWVPLWLSALVLLPVLVLGCLTLVWMFGDYLHLLTRLIKH